MNRKLTYIYCIRDLTQFFEGMVVSLVETFLDYLLSIIIYNDKGVKSCIYVTIEELVRINRKKRI